MRTVATIFSFVFLLSGVVVALGLNVAFLASLWFGKTAVGLMAAKIGFSAIVPGALSIGALWLCEAAE